MKQIILFSLIFLLPLCIYSQQSHFDYIEGEVTIKRISGDLVEARTGDSLFAGDSVITGSDGYAELILESTSLISIDSDTVFVFSKKENKGKKKNIFMVVLGKIGFKFDQLLNEPEIQTPATIAGIRGTSFTVVSALDGSSLYIVDEGSVAVEAEGSLVVLEMEEGVEVPLGKGPEEKFEVKIGSTDFSGWLDESNLKFAADPAGTLASVTEKLIEYSAAAQQFFSDWESSFAELGDLRLEMESVGNEKGADAKGDFYKRNVFPKEMTTSNLVLNYRYYTLSALSLRRYVLGSMYIDMKTKYIMDTDNPVFVSFLKEYENFLQIYENNVVPYLVEADI